MGRRHTYAATYRVGPTSGGHAVAARDGLAASLRRLLVPAGSPEPRGPVETAVLPVETAVPVEGTAAEAAAVPLEGASAGAACGLEDAHV